MIQTAEQLKMAPGVISEEDLSSFLAQMAEKALSHADYRESGAGAALPFQQTWWDSEAGELIDFAQIKDPEELKAASDKAERQYLAAIDEQRRDYVLKFPDYQQKNALRQFERGLCRTHLYYLVKFVLDDYPDLVFHLHYFMCETVSDVPEGFRGLREFPRDNFKTTCMGIGKCVQLIMQDPNVRILYKSNSQANASSKVTETKRHFMQNARVRELFPEHVPQNKAQEGSGSAWTSPAKKSVQAEPTISAAGVGTSKTSQHYDWVFCDDFWDRNSVGSPEAMGTARAEMGQLEYLLSTPARGRILFIGTRFAHDDPSIDLDKNPVFHCVFVSGVTPCGRSLFPENMTLKGLYAQFKGNLYQFSCQIMLNPTDDSRGFSRSWFNYLSWQDMKKQRDNGEIAVRIRLLTDATADGKETSDNISIQAVAIDNLGRKVVVDYIREKADPALFLDNLFQVYDKWSAQASVDLVARQKTAIETTIMAFVNRLQSERAKEGKRTLPFYDYSLKKREKKMRITSALQPLFQKGEIYFDSNVEAIPELERQLLQHPNTAEDDGPDSLSMLDDPALSQPPSFKAVMPPPPTSYMPETEEGQRPEDLWRKEQAKQFFEMARGDGKKRRVRPGSVIR